MTNTEKKTIFTDASRLITESLVRAGADVFIGYPITPANLVYAYSERRFPMFYAAPDEITTLQWMSGFAVTGKLPVTATSFPGYALMIESINMAYMMELPMVIILIQRLGPATGTATCGAQGDLNVVYGTLSGGYPLPCLSMSTPDDFWEMPPRALKMAVELRTPVVLLTSKEEVMTHRNLDVNTLKDIEPVIRPPYSGAETFLPYNPMDNGVPEFLPVTQNMHQVRYTASTHDKKGIIQNTTKEGLDNSRRLARKIEASAAKYLFYDLDEQKDSSTLLVTYGITSMAAAEAVDQYRSDGGNVSLLVMKTLSPLHDDYFKIFNRYENILVAEENLNGELKRILFGHNTRPGVRGVNKIGQMIEPVEIINELKNND